MREIFLGLVLLAGLSGVAPARAESGTGVGAGAVAGALVGGPIGAVVGAVAGGVIGSNSETCPRRSRRARVAGRRRAGAAASSPAPRRAAMAEPPSARRSLIRSEAAGSAEPSVSATPVWRDPR